MKPTDKFSGKADVYSKSRPSYPNEYIDYLLSVNSLNETSRVVDIGSGTGILTRQLLERGISVIAVEPNDDMRTKAEQDLQEFDQFISMKGSAEETSLPDKRIDLVIAAQAFHWFDQDKFKLECQRILKQEAKVALVWNSRDFSSPLLKENAEIFKKYCPNFYGFSGGIGEREEVFNQFFRYGEFEFKRFPNDLVLDFEGFLGRNLSASYSLKETDKEFEFFVGAITNLFEKYSHNGKIVMPNYTRSYLGNV
ncbi:ubiquinone/menaquinone biosynthesis C-methylase UbiE [Neobacillus niacini]|uniref:class I SAM-dependent methyltransferase n=1 Tax=Neobacillus driksii TaxID=3035913 RepID=UPI0027864C8F|nr:class I SAM-dependent methyltransferase [Neobacillus niacini]MDQ0970628.1 ubiquinone/menaquinone biosynthesis C-methylase UbiE [Neobacillus niacini]